MHPRWRRQDTRVPFKPSAPSYPAPPLGGLIDTITKTDLKPQKKGTEALSIENVEVVASYNWVDSPVPKIIVPGKPPRWTPLATPRKLKTDSGDYYRDRNAAAFPSHPMEPAIVATMKMNPKPRPIDVFACGSTLANLVRFIHDEELRTFRMLVEVVGNTVHLVRRENSPKELIPDVQGYGHTFPEAYTTWEDDVKGSKSHQRIIKYNFSGLELFVRFEGDGYIDDERIGLSNHPSSFSSPSASDRSEVLERLLAGIAVTSRPVNTNGSTLEVVNGGRLVPQNDVFELETRSIHRKDDDILGEQLHRLWVSQVPQLILGYHTAGLFDPIEINNITDDVLEWEELNQSTIQQFSSLLHRVIDLARSSDDGQFELVRSSLNKIEIRRKLPDVGKLLSKTVLNQWTAWLGNTANEGSRSGEEESYGGASCESDYDSDESVKDLTACDAECGYCGKCPY